MEHQWQDVQRTSDVFGETGKRGSVHIEVPQMYIHYAELLTQRTVELVLSNLACVNQHTAESDIGATLSRSERSVYRCVVHGPCGGQQLANGSAMRRPRGQKSGL
jgi:hypothetical protein